MASKMEIALGRGVIDTDYTREVKVIGRNHGEADCQYKQGDWIAQHIVEKSGDADASEVGKLATTERGEKGF